MLESSVDEGLRAFFTDARSRASEFGEHYAALWAALEQQSTGGKRIRPRLVYAAYEGFGGSDLPLATRVAVAFELLHTAFLIHDDVIDRDTVRRGIPTVSAEFAGRARVSGAAPETGAVWAGAAAILAGDLALSRAHREIATLPVDVERLTALLDILDRAVFVSAAGELADVVHAGARMPLKTSAVLDILEQKTAVYSFEAPLVAGAVLAGARSGALGALSRFGRFVGIAFQIADDILGVFGDPDVTGKSASSDLREGKQTVLIAHAATTSAWNTIAATFGDPALDERGVEALRTALRECGALDAARRLAREFVTLAQLELDAEELPTALRDRLRVIADSAAERVK